MPDIKKSYPEAGDLKIVSIEIEEGLLLLNQFNLLNDFVSVEIKSGVKSFIFDMKSLNTINSSGLGILISNLKKIKDSGCNLKVINISEKILSIFKLTKLDAVFEIENVS